MRAGAPPGLRSRGLRLTITARSHDTLPALAWALSPLMQARVRACARASTLSQHCLTMPASTTPHLTCLSVRVENAAAPPPSRAAARLPAISHTRGRRTHSATAMYQTVTLTPHHQRRTHTALLPGWAVTEDRQANIDGAGATGDALQNIVAFA